jgi:pimeloyl-ACP methyl ester carboxylesterase
MGGSVGIALAARAPSRFSSLIIGAADDATLSGQGFAELLAQGAAALVAVWEQQGQLSAGLRQRLLANDLEALAALANRPRPDESKLTDAFREAAMPRMLIAGELDPGFAEIAALAASLPEARFVGLPGLSHYESFRCADIAVPHSSASGTMSPPRADNVATNLSSRRLKTGELGRARPSIIP